MIVILDASTGKIYGIPIGVGKQGGQRMFLPGLDLSHAEVEFRMISRLWKTDACPDQPYKRYAHCYSYYYLWNNNDWRLLRRVRLEVNPF